MASPQSIKQALDRATAVLTRRPAKGQRTYTCTATATEGVACRIVERDEFLLADLPPAMGGEGRGPTPSMLLRAALASCTAMGVKTWAARREIEIDRVDVTVETDVDARGQLAVLDAITPGFEKIRMVIRVESSALRGAIEDIVAQCMRYSPLTDAFGRSHDVETHLTLIDSGDEGGR